MKPSDRDNTVNRIFRAPASHNKSCPILVTTVGLGGKIYTMTEAESCVIFSPQYVEATETQAKHRILRIGQQKETRSYRLVALHSIEPLIVERQHFRSAFDDAVFGQYRTGKAILTAEEMFRAMLRASSSKHGISAG
jgi:SNF2 family DNA or RNA helicase